MHLPLNFMVSRNCWDCCPIVRIMNRIPGGLSIEDYARKYNGIMALTSVVGRQGETLWMYNIHISH